MSRCSLHIQTHEGAVQGLELWGPAGCWLKMVHSWKVLSARSSNDPVEIPFKNMGQSSMQYD